MAADCIALEWRECKGFPSYEVSNDGQVRRRVDALQGQKARRAGSMLKPKRARSGHLMVRLYQNGRAHTPRIHRLVAVAFLGDPPGPQYVCCHNNGNPADNRLSNLRWDTQAGNLADTLRHGTRAQGATHGMAKLTAEQVLELRRRRAGGERCGALAREYGVSHGAVSLLTRGKTWAAIAVAPP